MLYFIRHGETDYNRSNLWMGRKDQPLNQAGIKQAKAAELVAQQHPDAPDIHIAEWLTERDFGSYEGMEKTNANRVAMNSSPTVESQESIARRLTSLENTWKAYEHLLIVSHSGVYRCLIKSLGYQSSNKCNRLKNAELVSLTRNCGTR